jgi:SAM-dependent methyltransferase
MDIIQGPRSVLVAIASYGKKNVPLLKKIIGTYRGFAFDTHIVVLSEAPKDLGPDVEVVVGLPSKNPWTLPFAHKAVFAERVAQYDLFIYSEDDIGITEAHIHAFLRATTELDADEIAGFLRYEISPSGRWYLDEPWGHFHWRPESVKRRGSYTIAEFTNEHAGFYILTQHQLKRAIATGGFLRGPCEGRYSWPETAATDPYTNCGYRKVICISALEDFLIHHMSDRYVELLDVSLESFKEQIQTLVAIRDSLHPATTLCPVESKLLPRRWQKSYYEKPRDELLNRIPGHAKRILSIGCGWGALERRLQERGAAVTALPLDSVIGAAAERKGVEVIYGTWDSSLKQLDGRKFDCVLLMNLLHLHANPVQMVEHCSRFVAEGGWLVLTGVNFDRALWFLKRVFRFDGLGKLRSYELSGFSVCGPKTFTASLANSGLEITGVHWIDHAFNRRWLRGDRIRVGRITAKSWLLEARRQ